MPIQSLSLPARTGPTTDFYVQDITALISKINEVAATMSIPALTISAVVGAGNPAADVNTIVSKLNTVITAVNAGQGSATSFDFTTSSSGFGQTLYDEQKSGYRRRSPFAVVELLTTANSVDLVQMSTNGGPLSVYLNNNFLAAPAGNTTLALPGSGTKLLRIADGPQSLPGDQGEVQGGWLTHLTFPTGTTNSLIQPTPTSNCLIITGDSIISEGYASTVPGRDGASYLLRGLLGCDVKVSGWGNRSFARSLGTDALLEAEAQRVVTGFGSAVNKTWLLALGTNDEVLNYATASEAAAIAGKLLDRVHTLDATITLYCFTRTLWLQSTSTAYADALKALKNTRPWLQVIDPVTWLVAADIHPADTGQLHPVSSGHAKLATYIRNTLAGLATPGNLGGQGNGWVQPPLDDLGYIVTSKTSAATQAGAAVSPSVSIPSTSAALTIPAGCERWQSAVFITGEALVFSSNDIVISLAVTATAGNKAATYGPRLKGFGILQISPDNGTTWFENDQSSADTAVNSDFMGYINCVTGAQTWLFRKKPGQPVGLYVCLDHLEYVLN